MPWRSSRTGSACTGHRAITAATSVPSTRAPESCSRAIGSYAYRPGSRSPPHCLTIPWRCTCGPETGYASCPSTPFCPVTGDPSPNSEPPSTRIVPPTFVTSTLCSTRFGRTVRMRRRSRRSSNPLSDPTSPGAHGRSVARSGALRFLEVLGVVEADETASPVGIPPGADASRRLRSAFIRRPGVTRPFRFGVTLQPVSGGRAAWLEVVKDAEQCGFSTVTVMDHFRSGGIWSALTAAHDAASSLRLGTLVLNSDLCHPLLIAREAITR